MTKLTREEVEDELLARISDTDFAEKVKLCLPHISYDDKIWDMLLAAIKNAYTFEEAIDLVTPGKLGDVKKELNDICYQNELIK